MRALLAVLLLTGCATGTDFSQLSSEQKIQLYSVMSQSLQIHPYPVQYQPMVIQPYQTYYPYETR